MRIYLFIILSVIFLSVYSIPISNYQALSILNGTAQSKNITSAAQTKNITEAAQNN